MGQKGREQAAVRKIWTDKCLKRQELQRNEYGNGKEDVFGRADSELIWYNGLYSSCSPLNSPVRPSATLSSHLAEPTNLQESHCWIKSVKSTVFHERRQIRRLGMQPEYKSLQIKFHKTGKENAENSDFEYKLRELQ